MRIIAVIILLVSLAMPAAAAEKWEGVDDTVVGKISKEHGRPAMAPLLDPGEGDLLLFAFMCAGTVGGFAAGYYWRKLMENKTEKRD